MQTKVADALRELAARPSQLDYQPLSASVDVVSRDDWPLKRHAGQEHGGTVELHVVPLAPSPIRARLMRAMPDRLIGALRGSAAVPAHAGLDPQVDDDGAALEVPAGPGQRMGTVSPGILRGVRVSSSGQVSVWSSLPNDGMGSMLNEGELAEGCARALPLAGAIGLPDAARYGVAIGISGSLINLVNGALPQSGRTSTSYGILGDRPIRVTPDESLPAAAFDNGADEVARDLAAAVLAGSRSRSAPPRFRCSTGGFLLQG